MKNLSIYFLVISLLLIQACESPKQAKDALTTLPKGKLFIIGGGKRPAEMVKEMIQLSGTDTTGYIVVMPMSSVEPDTSFYYAKKQFIENGALRVLNFQVDSGVVVSQARLDSVKNAAMIYIPGGAQTKFMNVVVNTPLHEAIKTAYQNGSVIGGTSAGAAVMSKKMITGNEFKHPEYTGDFRTIEAENMEIKEGLGLMENAIIDQHFIKRMRMNRLITVAIENPGYACIGIDESTAIVVNGDSCRVTGVSQVIVIFNDNLTVNKENGLLGAENMELSVYLPGDVFSVK
ncbi:MAG: cyanophycinase [Bacteroidetes bacterium]|nr:cyanophycinase [Bacteroidota bacterium]